MTYTGGYLDRLIIAAVTDVVREGLDALGWLDTNRSHMPVTLRSGPVAKDKQIQYNTAVLSFELADAKRMEIGSDAKEITHTGYLDFYAEPAPDPDDDDNTFNGGEALGKHFIGDCMSILVGDIPEIGRDRPVIDVYDYGLATPPYLFSVYVDDERTRTAKVHRYDQPWERNWYTCVFELTEERDFAALNV